MNLFKIRTSFMFCQLAWISSASFVNHELSGGTDNGKKTLLQDDADLPVRRIIGAVFYEENSALFLQHAHGQKSVAHLVVEDDCLFRGSMLGYSDSVVLVTGCKGDLQGVQIQSQLFGDMMFTMQDNVMMPLGSQKHRRDADSLDYEDYDDVLDNPMFERLFGTLDSAEAEDLPPPPSQLELHVIVHVDKLWRDEFGRKGGPREVRNIMKQAALLLNHPTLETKLKLVYDEANLRTSSEHLLPKNSDSFYNGQLLKQLNGPNLTTRGEPTVHLYLTVEGDGEKSYVVGKAKINTMCGFAKPRLIVVHRGEELRTAMTVAHEIGHILGLEHDFILGKRSKTCGGTTEEGPFVMNYGDTRQSFSECSNIDFKSYYHLVVVKNGNFCLTQGLVGCQCNGVENILGIFGKCTETPSGAKCYVNEDSGCKDMTPYHGQFLSSSPCASTDGQKQGMTGVLITGGYPDGALTSTELYLPGTGKTCSLQSLPDDRWWHSLDTAAGKIILCGGVYTQTSCLQFLPTSSTGSWAHYATLAQGRYAHTTHSFQGDLLLVGGDGSQGITEILGKGRQYDLQQHTRDACSIPDQSSYILIGGYNFDSGSLKTVAKYNMQGYVGSLPDLATARYGHGCGYYLAKGDTMVLVVAGGYGSGRTPLSSTEVLPPGATAWSTGQSLPRTLYRPASVNMGGYLLIIGGYDGSNSHGEVLKFNGSWTEVGRMKTARSAARAAKIEIPGEGGLLDISACL